MVTPSLRSKEPHQRSCDHLSGIEGRIALEERSEVASIVRLREHVDACRPKITTRAAKARTPSKLRQVIEKIQHFPTIRDAP